MVSRLVRTELRREMESRHGPKGTRSREDAHNSRRFLHVVLARLPVGGSVPGTFACTSFYHRSIGFRVARYLPPEMSGEKGFADAK